MVGRLSAAADATATVDAMAAAAAGSISHASCGITLGTCWVSGAMPRARFASWVVDGSVSTRAIVDGVGWSSGGAGEPAAGSLGGVILVRWERGSAWPGQSVFQDFNRDWAQLQLHLPQR